MRNKDNAIVNTLDSSWIQHIKNAIEAINEAAPGLYLYLQSSGIHTKIKIYGLSIEDCYTIGEIWRRDGAKIFLGDPCEDKKGTAVHELMHTLGFGHEHQRRDAKHYVDTSKAMHDAEWKDQYDTDESIQGITRFDPFSIILRR